jgi:hypothetical protein
MSEQAGDPSYGLAEVLTPARRRDLEQARWLAQQGRGGLAWHHQLGLLSALAEGAACGGRPVPQLARALGLSRVGVYQHLQFMRYCPSAVQVEACSEGGRSWAAAVVLFGADKADRACLQRAAVGQNEKSAFGCRSGGGWAATGVGARSGLRSHGQALKLRRAPAVGAGEPPFERSDHGQDE